MRYRDTLGYLLDLSKGISRAQSAGRRKSTAREILFSLNGTPCTDAPTRVELADVLRCEDCHSRAQQESRVLARYGLGERTEASLYTTCESTHLVLRL